MPGGNRVSVSGQCELIIDDSHPHYTYLSYTKDPHTVVVFSIASNVKTGMSSPEKNATLRVCPIA